MKLLISILFLMLLQNKLIAQNPIPSDSIFHLSNVGEKETALFKDILQKIAEERWFKNDSAFIAQHYHQNFIHTYENGRSRNKQQIFRIRSRPVSTTAQEKQQNQFKIEIEKVIVQLYNKAAIIHYFIDMQLVFNNQAVHKLFRCTDIFVKQKKDWQVVSHTETVVPGTPTPIKIDNSVYKDYVGQYKLTPDVTYTVSEKGGRLFWGRNQGFELVPESQHIFGFKVPPASLSPNSLYRIHFVRNGQEEVTHLHMIEYAGVEYDAIKVK
jgi:hypothetical protein